VGTPLFKQTGSSQELPVLLCGFSSANGRRLGSSAAAQPMQPWTSTTSAGLMPVSPVDVRWRNAQRGRHPLMRCPSPRVDG